MSAAAPPRRRVLAVASLGSAVSPFDLTLMFVTYPSIRKAFPDVSLAKISFVLTAYSIVAAALLIPAGRLADRLGRSRTFFWGLRLFALGTTASALAPSVDLLIAARVLQAAGGALITPSSLGLIMSVFPPEKRSSALGIWSSVTSTFTSTAPVLGALAVRLGGWRWAFVISLPICLFCLIVGPRTLPRDAPDHNQALPDPVGSAMIVVALAALAYAIVQSNTWGWADRATFAVLAVPALLLPAFLWRCRHHPAPVIDFEVVRQTAGFGGLAAYAVSIGILYWGAYYVLVRLLTNGWDYPVVAAGLRLVPVSIPALFLGRLTGRMIDRHGFRRIMIPAALGFGASLLCIAAMTGGRPVMALWIPAAFLFGWCNNTLFIGCNTAGAASAPIASLSVMTGLVQTIVRIGGVIGAALAVSLTADAGSGHAEAFRSPVLQLAGLTVVTAATVLLLRNRHHAATHLKPEAVPA